jgi:hypothetical protein
MPNLHARGHQLERRLQRLSTLRWSPAPLMVRQRETYVRIAPTGHWDRVVAQAQRERVRARRGLVELRPIRDKVRSIGEEADSFTSAAKSSWTPLQSRADWPAIRAEILQGAPASLPRAKANKLVDSIGALGSTQITKQVLQPVDDMAVRVEASSASWHSGLVGAELARSVATFNLRVRPTLGPTATVRTFLRTEATSLRTHQQRIHKALARGDETRIEAAADALLASASGAAFGTALKTAAALARARSNPSDRWSLGPLALETGELIRALLLAQALAHRTAWVNAAGLATSERWRDAATRLSFPTNWTPPATTKLSAIAAQAAQLDGTVISVEGVVGPVTNLHQRRKVLSSAWLFDDRGHGIRIGVTHFKLDTTGLVEGAYARVTGRYSVVDTEFGEPLVRIGRRTLGADSKQSWTDWTALELRRIFTPVPHGLTMSWTWERGVNGANNQLRYGSWIPFRQEVTRG